MKSLSIIFILIFTSCYSYSQGSNGLIAHWNFNGNANDVSGNNLNGIVFGATLSAGYNGIANTAYQFNGINNHIDIPANSLLNLDTFSICALVKPTGYYSGVCEANSIMIMGSDQDTALSMYGLYFSNAIYYGGCSSNNLDHEIFYGLGHHVPGSASILPYSSSDTVILNTWYCVVATYSHDTVRTYVDGILQSKEGMVNNFSPIYDTLGIGYYRRGVIQYPYWFNGIMDDIRLYNHALSDSEISMYCDSAKLNTITIDTTVAVDSVSSAVLCAGSSFNVFYSVNHNFLSGNVFTVQLSNSFGNFSSPIMIGSVIATTSGVIACTIPAGTSIGTGYEIRIVASSPAYTSTDISITIGTGSLAAPGAGNNSPICAGDTLKLNSNSITSGVNYSWTGPDNFTSALQNPVIINAASSAGGTYSVTISSTGCTNSANTTVTIYPNEIPSFTINGDPCAGESLIVAAGNVSFDPNYYNWNFGTADLHSGSGAGPYSISWTVAGNEIISLSYTGNCKPADTQAIFIQPLPVDHIVAGETSICSGDTIMIHPSIDSAAYIYKWFSGAYYIDSNAAATSAIFNHSGNIYLHIYNQYGCMGVDSLFIVAEPCCNLFVPNAFTPNGDNKNDIFRIKTIRHFENYSLIIFNKWGQEVFNTKSQEEGWDGSFNGTKQEIGTYFYYIKYTCAGKTQSKKGDLTLLR